MKLILHICLICGSMTMISVDDYMKQRGDSDGVMYGCSACGYAFSIDGDIDLEDPELFDSEDVDTWKDEDWERVRDEYFEQNPEEKDMLNYQKAITKSANMAMEILSDPDFMKDFNEKLKKYLMNEEDQG